MYDYFTNLHDYLLNSAKKYPNKTALMCGKTQYSYSELDAFSNQVAHYLQNVGLQRGERVTICLDNILPTVVCFWAVLKAGGVVSIVNPELDIVKLKYIIHNSHASAFVGTQKQYLQIREDISSLDTVLKAVILILPEINDDDANTVYFDDILQSVDASFINNRPLDIDMASIIYTSGSTGEPKGVTLTHRNMLAASTSINQYLLHNKDDVIISVLPISFDYGLYQMIMAFSQGATLILEKNFLWPTQLLKKISDHRVTVLPLVPTMVQLLYEHNQRFNYDLNSVRCITNTGAALHIQHIEMLKQLFPKAKIFSMYGLTECKRCTYLPPDLLKRKPTSVGVAIPNTELWVVDDEGRRLGANQIGQLVIRGATVMQGYWNNPEATAQKIKPGLYPGEKVLYTGDYCWLDEDGHLYFHSRMDEVIKCRGIKVSPKEIEECLLKMNGITEAAAIGVEDLELGTAIYVFLAARQSASEKDVHDYCKQNLSAEKRPKYVSIISSLPKTANGKIDKLLLKERAKSQLIN